MTGSETVFPEDSGAVRSGTVHSHTANGRCDAGPLPPLRQTPVDSGGLKPYTRDRYNVMTVHTFETSATTTKYKFYMIYIIFIIWRSHSHVNCPTWVRLVTRGLSGRERHGSRRNCEICGFSRLYAAITAASDGPDT